MNDIVDELFKELHKIGKKKMGSFKEISKTEMDILLHLKFSKKNLNPSELSDLLGLSRSSITLLLNEMEEKGYLKRVLDSDDRRRMNVVLSPKGKQIIKKHFEKFYGNIKETLCKIGESDAKELLRILKKINER